MSTSLVEAKLPSDGLFIISYHGNKIAICKTGVNYVAIENRCPHLNESFAKGKIKNGAIICPLHEYRFDLLSGSECQSRAKKLTKYPLKVEENALWISL